MPLTRGWAPYLVCRGKIKDEFGLSVRDWADIRGVLVYAPLASLFEFPLTATLSAGFVGQDTGVPPSG